MVLRLMENYMEEYTGIADMTVGGVLWNGVMHFLECCGIENWEDFKDLDGWPDKALKDYTVDVDEFKDWIKENKWVANLPDNNEHLDKVLMKLNCSLSGEDKNRVGCDWWDYDQFKTPMMCCKQIADIPSGCHLDSAVTEENNWFTEGCHAKVIEFIDKNGGGAILRVLQLFAAWMTAYCIMIFVYDIVGPEEKENVPVDNSSLVSDTETPKTKTPPSGKKHSLVKEDNYDVVNKASSISLIEEQPKISDNRMSSKSSSSAFISRKTSTVED